MAGWLAGWLARSVWGKCEKERGNFIVIHLQNIFPDCVKRRRSELERSPLPRPGAPRVRAPTVRGALNSARPINDTGRCENEGVGSEWETKNLAKKMTSYTDSLKCAAVLRFLASQIGPTYNVTSNEKTLDRPSSKYEFNKRIRSVYGIESPKKFHDDDIGRCSPVGKEQNGHNGLSKDDGSEENGNSRPSSRQSSQVSYGNSAHEDYQRLIQQPNKLRHLISEQQDNNKLLPHQLLSRAQLQILLKQHSIFIQDQQNHHKQYHPYFPQQRNGLERRQLEQIMQQIQERLQANFIQQTHLLDAVDKKGGEVAQSQLLALRQEQQQLMQQWQFTQRKYLLQRGLNPGEIPSPWKEHPRENVDGTHGSVNFKNFHGPNGKLLFFLSVPILMHLTRYYNRRISGILNPFDLIRWDGFNGLSSLPEEFLEEFAEKLNPLYGHGVCKWPGCESDFDDFQAFNKHLNSDHNLDDRATAQARVQMQVVSQLEIQLQKERDRLHAMMTHLHMAKQAVEQTKTEQQETKLNISSGPTMDDKHLDHISFSKMIAEVRSSVLQPLSSNISPSVRRKINEKNNSTLVGGLPYMLERAGLDVQQEIQRNQEFYKNADVRPPFTYASLIRQEPFGLLMRQNFANVALSGVSLGMCGFVAMLAKSLGPQSPPFNAIRTNLSLHKCFVRYEDDFGSFWMVDDAEFVKRRHLSRGRPRKYDPAPSPTPPQSAAQGIQSKCNNGTNGLNGNNIRHSPVHYDGKFTPSAQTGYADTEMNCVEDCSMPKAASPLMSHTEYSRQTPVHIKEEDVGTNLIMSKNGLARIKQEMEQSMDQSDVRDDRSAGTNGQDEEMMDNFDESDGDERNSIPFEDSEKSREV
ncbi:hypothetical protein RUM43_014200 [Polyplax serrata]|uniref:Fork-head domain-containing protein n=1 Tax=Polyplax serrata TaxID=468196 RepID=A0AAN8PGI2_POLSC